MTETHATSANIPLIQKDWNAITKGTSFFAPSQQSNKEGVAILCANNLIKPNIDNIQILIPARALTLEIMVNNNKHKILCVYAPNNPTERQNFFKEVLSKAPTNIPTIWGGDFNCVEIESLDRTGPRKSTHTVGSSEIHTFNHSMELCDPFRTDHPTTKEFTYRDKTSILEPKPRSRIDRIYIPKTHMKGHKTIFLPTQLTDHHMVLTSFILPDTPRKARKGLGIWKFNTKLIDNETFMENTQNIIEDFIEKEDRYQDILTFWDILKQNIKKETMKFSRIKRKRENIELDDAKRQLESEQKSQNPNQNIIDECKIKIAKSEKIQIESLLLRAKLDQIELDEQPTTYFYKRMKIRAENSNPERLYDKNNILKEDQDDILEVTQKYYEDLYDLHPTEIVEESQNILLDKLDQQLSLETRENLEKDLTLDDLKRVLKHAPNNKTPGIDGLPYEFYKAFPILLPILLRVSHYAPQAGHMTNTQQKGLMVLIHKKGDKENLDNWRPVSLPCADYKLIAKAHADKLRLALPEIINADQTAGVPGREITDNLWLMRDLFDYSAEQRAPGYLVSLDQSKAFDRVSHSFLDKVMTKFGFGPKFKNWITTIYKGSISYIQNNGHLSLPVPIKRGVRQGCPLSAYLYIMVAETLAQAIRTDPQIHGYAIPNLRTVKIVQYADDTHNFIAYKDKEHSIKRLINALNLYQGASGSKLNFDKSIITAFGGTADTKSNAELALELMPSLPEPWKVQPLENGILILGIIFKATPAETYQANYQLILEKMEDRIQFLKLRQLSIKGRAQALNTLVLPKIWYVASVIPLCTLQYKQLYTNKPNYLKLIQDKAKSYLWNNKAPLLTQEVLYLPPDRGGLSIVNIGIQSIALRTKQINKVLDKESNTPSTRLARYWLATPYLASLHPGTWFLKNYIAPKTTKPLPYNGQTRKGYTSLSLLIEQKVFIKALFRDLKNPPTTHIIYKKLLREMNFTIKGEIRWRELGLPMPQWKNSWQNLAPPIHQEKLWKTKHFILHQRDRIDTQHIPNKPPRKPCSFCQQKQIRPTPPDTHLHALALCPQAKDTWDELQPLITKIDYACLPSRRQEWILGIKGTNKKTLVLNTLISSAIHILWTAKNEQDKENKTTPPKIIAKKITQAFKAAITYWFLIHKRNKSLESFKKQILIQQICTIDQESLQFYI